jgi:hypothetical protein
MRGLQLSSGVFMAVAAASALALLGCEASSTGAKPDAAVDPLDIVQSDAVQSDAVQSDAVQSDAVQPAACPAVQPTTGAACTEKGLSCSWGTQTCCGSTHPSVQCQCSGESWLCGSTDACLGGGWCGGDAGALEDTALADTDSPDVAMIGDTPFPADLPLPLDVSAPEDTGGNPAECPVEQPMPGGTCTVEGTSCSWGTETCCGKTHPSFLCSCMGGSWACAYSDACMGARFMCPDVTDSDAGPGPEQDVVTPDGPTDLLAAGWSFGECMGACVGVLTFKGASVSLTVKSHDGTVDHEANGILTTGGAAKLETVLAALDGVAVDPVYGCPDCADGGAKTITLYRSDVTSTHSYEYGNPPAVFTELDGIIFGAAQGLRDCVTSEAVVVLGQCPMPIP